MRSEFPPFIDTLFGEKPEDLYVVIWTARDKATKWFSDLKAASRYIKSRSQEDIYVGVALFQEKRRLTENAKGIVGLWIDIDFQAPYRKKRNLPPDLDTVKPWIFGCGYDPSLVVHTGNGIQPWWLFKEPWTNSIRKKKERKPWRSPGGFNTRSTREAMVTR